MHRIRRASDGCHCRSASTTMAMRLKASVTLSKLAEATPSTRDLPQMHRPEKSTLPWHQRARLWPSQDPQMCQPLCCLKDRQTDCWVLPIHWCSGQ